MSEQEIEIRVLPSLGAIDAAIWDACACPEAANGARPNDPFTTYRFLKALEDSNSVGPGTGWQPQYLQAIMAGQTIGVAPMYAKSHSQGEYIFDHNWAHAYERSGGRYYPKLQIAVPHTPATGLPPFCKVRFNWRTTTTSVRCMSRSAPKVSGTPGPSWVFWRGPRNNFIG